MLSRGAQFYGYCGHFNPRIPFIEPQALDTGSVEQDEDLGGLLRTQSTQLIETHDTQEEQSGGSWREPNRVMGPRDSLSVPTSIALDAIENGEFRDSFHAHLTQWRMHLLLLLLLLLLPTQLLHSDATRETFTTERRCTTVGISLGAREKRPFIRAKYATI